MKRQTIFRAVSVMAVATALGVGGVQPSWADGKVLTPVSGVVSLDGVPIAGVELCDPSGADGGGCTTTAADGGYTLPIDRSYFGGCLTVRAVTAAHRGLFADISSGARQGVPCILRVGSSDHNNIALKSFAFDTGSVIDEAGRPVVGAIVSGGTYNSTVTDSAGKFSIRIETWQDNDGMLRISAPGYEVARNFNRGGVAFGPIMLAPVGQTDRYAISGVVTNLDANPVAGAQICVEAGPCVATTDAHGAYAALLSGRVDDFSAWRLQARVGSGTVLAAQTLQVERRSNFATGVDFRLQVLQASTPVIAGKVRVGSVLVAKPGHWGPAPVTFTYRWYANSKPIRGATSPKLKLKKAQQGKRITVRIVGSKAIYDSVAKISRPTKPVRSALHRKVKR